MSEDATDGQWLRRRAAMLLAGGLLSGLLLVGYGVVVASRRSGTPLAFTMPGSITATLDAGTYGIYGPARIRDGSRRIASSEDVTVKGPMGDVPTSSTLSFFSDPDSVVDGDTDYQIFERFSVPQTGSYEITVGSSREPTDDVVPIRLAAHHSIGQEILFVVLGILVGSSLVFLGFVEWAFGVHASIRARTRGGSPGRPEPTRASTAENPSAVAIPQPPTAPPGT